MRQPPEIDLEALCRKPLESRSKYQALATKRCHKPRSHAGSCAEFPFLSHLRSIQPRVAQKIHRDPVMTTGAAWKSEEAGPNRIPRWVMLLPDAELLEYGVNMSGLKPQVVRKLRDKAADYDSCIRVGIWLTRLAYCMDDAPDPVPDVRDYLEAFFGPLRRVGTLCTICLLPLSFGLFDEARRGRAAVETCHMDPRVHSPGNVGFAHRECNIAQGPKSLEEFYDWIHGILQRARPHLVH